VAQRKHKANKVFFIAFIQIWGSLGLQVRKGYQSYSSVAKHPGMGATHSASTLCKSHTKPCTAKLWAYEMQATDLRQLFAQLWKARGIKVLSRSGVPKDHKAKGAVYTRVGRQVPMKLDWLSRIALAIIALSLALLTIQPWFEAKTVFAQNGTANLYIEPGTTMIQAPDRSSQFYGKVVVDLQRGKIGASPR
jgi:hypothetical protein